MKPNPILKISLSAVVLVGGFLGGSLLGQRGERSTPTPSNQPSAAESSAILAPDSGSVLAHLSLDEIHSLALDEASKSESERNQSDLELLFYEWIQRDPLGALSFAKDNQRMDWLMAGLELAGRSHPEDAFRWLDENVKEVARKQFLQGEIYRGFAQANPEEAMATIDQLESGPQRNQLLTTVLGEWIHQDADEVFNWFEKQEFSPFLTGTYTQLMGAFINDNPEGAAALILQMENNERKPLYANQTGKELAKDDPQKALEWVEGLEGESKQAALEGIIDEWGYSGNELEALEYVQNLPEGSDRDQLSTTLIKTVSYGDPELLKQILPSLDDSQQEVAATQLARTFTKLNPETAMDWIESLPEGAVKDAGIASSAKVRSSFDLAESLEVAAGIGDDSLREKTVQQAISIWMDLDRDKALAALNQTEALSPDQKARMSEQLNELPLESSNTLSIETNYVLPPGLNL